MGATGTLKTLPFAVEKQCLDLGARLSVARRRRRLTQADLARRAGVSKLTVGRVERGAPTAELSSVVRILWALGLERSVEALASDDAPAISARRAAQIAEEWLGYFESSGATSTGYWNTLSPVIGEIADVEVEIAQGQLPVFSTPSVWAYKVAITRMVNGVPFLGQYARLWIHRSGQVMRVEVSGVSPKTSGPVGLELPTTSISPFTINISHDSSISLAKAYVEKSGFDAHLD